MKEKNFDQLDQFLHHQPRKTDKKKHHKRGFSEDVQETRKVRIGFKNYLRELKEQSLEEDINITNGRPLTDKDEQFLIEDFKQWANGSTPDECGDDQLQEYAYTSCPNDLDEQEVLRFLRNYIGE